MPPKKSRRRAPKAAAAPRPARTPRSTLLLLALALALITAAVFAQVRTHEFVDLDDTGYVVTNPHVTTGLTMENVRWAMTSGYAANWHPLTWMSHQLDVSLFGMNPGRHHLTNVFWHVLGTLMLFGLLHSMTGTTWRSAFVAALFAVHPTRAESVAWVAERKDVLSAFLWFATTWAYVAWTRRPGAARYAAVLGLFALGLMAKPMLVTLPFTLLLLDIWPLGRHAVPWPRRLMEKAPLVALAAVSSVVTAIVQTRGGAVGSIDVIPMTDRALNAVLSYGRYLRMLVWPSGLAVLYPFEFDLPMGSVALSAIVVVAISFAVWRARKTMPYLLVGWLWYLGTLLPVIGLVQFGMHALADRYTYVPYVGLLIAIAWGLADAAKRAGLSDVLLRSVGAAVVALAAVAAYAQTGTWQDAETMWRQAVMVTANNPRAHNGLGAAYGNSGRPAEAAAEFLEAARLRPDVSDAKEIFPNLARALMEQGKLGEAVPYYERAIQLNPERADLRHGLALAFAGLGRNDEAVAAWREAIRINPKFDDAYFMMGMILANQGKVAEAKAALAETIRLNPSRTDAQQALAALGGKSQ